MLPPFSWVLCPCVVSLQAYQEGTLQKLLKMNGSEDPPQAYDFDLIIIGGGSGGLAAAKARPLALCSLNCAYNFSRVPCALCRFHLIHSCGIFHVDLAIYCFSELKCSFFMKKYRTQCLGMHLHSFLIGFSKILRVIYRNG